MLSCNQSFADLDILLALLQVFQRREDGSTDFKRAWHRYHFGFGNLSGEHWLGKQSVNDPLSNLVRQRRIFAFDVYSVANNHHQNKKRTKIRKMTRWANLAGNREQSGVL